MGGRKCFWSQLNDSKTVRDRPNVSIGANMNEPMGELLSEPITGHHVSQTEGS